MECHYDNEHIYEYGNEITSRRHDAPQDSPRSNSKEVLETPPTQNGEAAVSRMNGKLLIIFSVMVAFFIATLAVLGVQSHWIAKLNIQNRDTPSKNFELIEELKNMTRVSERNLINMMMELNDAARNETRVSEDNLIGFITEYDCRRQGGLLHSGKCFTLPHFSSSPGLYDTSYDEAVAECARHGALMAEINNRSQQTDLYLFALTKIPAGKWHIWLGMEYKHSTSTLLYRSGMEIHSNQFQWYPGFPDSSSSRKYMAMVVRNDGDSDIGLFNYVKSNLPAVMCEKEI